MPGLCIDADLTIGIGPDTVRIRSERDVAVVDIPTFRAAWRLWRGWKQVPGLPAAFALPKFEIRVRGWRVWRT